MNLSKLSAAPVEVMLAGKPYRLSPMTLADSGELDNWLRSRVVRMARESLDPTTPAAERAETLRAAMDYAAGLHWMSAEGKAIITTPEGIARLCWQGLRKNHPDLTVEAVAALIADPAALDALMDAFDLANGTSDDAEKKSAEAVTEGGLTPGRAAPSTPTPS